MYSNKFAHPPRKHCLPLIKTNMNFFICFSSSAATTTTTNNIKIPTNYLVPNIKLREYTK